MLNRNLRDKNTWIFIAAAIALLAFIFTVVSQKNNQTLEVYTNQDQVTEAQAVAQDPLRDMEMQQYQDANLDFSLSVPADWEYVEKSGCPTYVHRESGSAIQIDVQEYNPEINTDNAESLAASLSQNGQTYVDFQYTSNASYELLYQGTDGNVTYDYIREVYWDRQHIVTLLCTFSDEDYNKINPYFQKIINSFAWYREDEIPEGFYLTYVPDAAFEVGIPENWSTAIDGNAYVAVDNNTGATMYMQVLDGGTDLSSMTAASVTSLYSAGKEGYMLTDFVTTPEYTYSQSAYYVNDIQYVEDAFIFSNGILTYSLLYDYPKDSIDPNIPLTSASLFREFLVKTLESMGDQMEVINEPQPQEEQGIVTDEADGTHYGEIIPPSQDYIQNQAMPEEDTGISFGNTIQEEIVSE